MTMQRWSGSAMVGLATAKRWDGSSMVDLTVAKRWNGAAWVDIPLPGGGGGGGPLTATVSPGTVSAFSQVTSGPSVKTLTTIAATVTAAGGSGAYTYAWSQVNGSSGITASSPTSASTTFRCTVPKNSERNAQWKCVVSDGTNSVTVTVFVEFYYYAGQPL